MDLAKTVAVLVGILVVGIVSGCANRREEPPEPPDDLARNIGSMLSYEGNGDGKIAREELDRGLERQFAVADRNGDGVLETMEVQRENDARYAELGTGFSPLIDWNRDGRVDLTEFATTARSLFEALDRDGNGVLEGAELRVPRPRSPNSPRRGPVGPF